MIWTLPDGQTYVTTPGSALLFPTLCAPTGDVPVPEVPRMQSGDRTAMMPTRKQTRAQNRAQRVATERRQIRQAREARRQAREAALAAYYGTAPLAGENDEPPPF